ncbi:hypothetical protein G6L11_20155 [Agrobacterium tumefaciens]|nr:hypothetical protein [Agrobacterium tumefaciens]NTA71803.1 hypothetical protein [Agrobacterium tumefaciens]
MAIYDYGKEWNGVLPASTEVPFHKMISSGKEQRRELKAPYQKRPFLPFEPKRTIGHGCDHEA